MLLGWLSGHAPGARAAEGSDRSPKPRNCCSKRSSSAPADKRPDPQTIKLLRESAGLGGLVAQDILGQLYLNGSGAVRDQAEALKWFKRAAEGGLAMGQDHLGNLYENGAGTRHQSRAGLHFIRETRGPGIKRRAV